VPEALYRMWANGVSLVTWFTLRDQPLATSFYQSGLYYRGATLAADRAKPFLEGFRFPFVAFRQGRRVTVWARTPDGRAGRVRIEQRVGNVWRTLATVSANRDGIVTSSVVPKGSGVLRAQLNGESSLPFSLRAIPDRFYNPFGQTSLGHP
jgi:hypothetical protein